MALAIRTQANSAAGNPYARVAMPGNFLTKAKSEPVLGGTGARTRDYSNRQLVKVGQAVIGGGMFSDNGRPPCGWSKDNSIEAFVANRPGGAAIVAARSGLSAHGFMGLGPPKAGAYKIKNNPGVFRKAGTFTADPNPATDFRRYFERGDIPVSIRHGAQLNIEWKVEPEKLDYMHYLPMLIDGLQEKTHPFDVAAEKCVYDMLSRGKGQILPVIPRLIIPLKRCLNTKDPGTVAKCFAVIKQLVLSEDKVGEALVPYYRQILPACNLFRSKNRNLGDGIDYKQRFNNCLGDLVDEMLHLLEKHGGEDAFVNIKYMIPTYESVIY